MRKDPSWKGQERRHFHRASKKLQVSWHKFDNETASIEDTALDVSLGGLALRSDARIPVGAHLYVTIKNEDGELVTEMPCVVKWISPHPEDNYHIIGVEFLRELDADKGWVLELGPEYLKKLDGLQNRMFVRAQIRAPIRFKKSFLSGWKKGVTIDLGLGGVRFTSKSGFSRGAKVSLRFGLPGIGDIEAQGIVVGQIESPSGDGFKVSATFFYMSDQSARKLADFIVDSLKPKKTTEFTESV